MSRELPQSVRSILLDIEGTTTPISFVYEELFPYARSHARPFLAENCGRDDVRTDLAALRGQHAADRQDKLEPPPLVEHPPEKAADSHAAYVHWLMDRDSKCTPLKSLQGKIWKAGYETGGLRSRVFPDVPRAFERWRRQEKTIGIFSSGSVQAQRLLFAHTQAGDLTSFIQAYFDTTTGVKTAPESYRRIARTWGRAPEEIVFVSDVTRELAAAREAGMEVLLSVRPGNRAQPDAENYTSLESFDALFP